MADMLDWSTEYDVFHPQYIADPFTIWDELREKCPIAHTDNLGGSWLPTTYEHVTTIARDIEHFSSKSITVVPPLDPDAEPITIAAPIAVDPPLHTYSRRTILQIGRAHV